MEHKNWNWNDGTPEDGPSLSSVGFILADEDTLTFCTDLIKKHDDLAKQLGFQTEVTWLAVPAEIIAEAGVEDENTTRIYAWDSDDNYHEIVCTRTDATTDDCRIRFVRDFTEINVTWAQEG